MGGVLAAWIIPITEVEDTHQTSGCINVVLATGGAWRDCKVMHMKAVPDDQLQMDSGGTLCNSTISIDSLIDESDSIQFRRYLAVGCLIKLALSTGQNIVYGTKDYPMVGGIVRHVGENPADSICWKITASNGTFDGPLVLL